MDEQYFTRIREGMRPRSKQSTIPYKFRETDDSYTTISKEEKDRDLDLKDYARLYATIHCQLEVSDNDKIMTDQVVTTILTQYHASKVLKFLVQKEQMHYLPN